MAISPFCLMDVLCLDCNRKFARFIKVKFTFASFKEMER